MTGLNLKFPNRSAVRVEQLPRGHLIVTLTTATPPPPSPVGLYQIEWIAGPGEWEADIARLIEPHRARLIRDGLLSPEADA